MTTIRFTANVNDVERSVDIDADHPELATWSVAWTDGTTQGGEPDQEDLDAIEELVMNNEYLYDEFYSGADQDERDADLVDITVEVV